MNLYRIKLNNFNDLPQKERLCIISYAINEVQSEKIKDILEKEDVVELLSQRCFKRSNLTKPEMHLYQNIILAYKPKWKALHYHYIFSYQNTFNDWDTHFLIRCLKEEETVNNTYLVDCIKELIDAWFCDQHCICHILERCLRLVSSYDSNLSKSLVQYQSHHSLCTTKYYYKVINNSMKCYDLSVLQCQLDDHPNLSSPYYLQAYFKMSEISNFKLNIPFLKQSNLLHLLSVLSEKDTLFSSVFVSIVNFSLSRNNCIALHFFYLFSEYYEYDVDIIVSMLDESADILLILSGVCKLMDLFPSFPYYQSLISFLREIRDVFEMLENRRLIDYSIQPIINRLTCTIHSLNVSFNKHSTIK